MSSSIYKKFGIAALIMMTSVFLSRLAGFLRLIVIAYIGGRSAEVDAYQVAFVIPEILNHIVASGFLSITFIPIFSRYLAEDREADGWKVFSIILSSFGLLLLLLIVIGIVFTPEVVALIARGRTEPDFRQYVVKMTRIILPAQFFFFGGGLFMAVQFAKEKFFIPALAPLVYNLGIIAGGLLLGPKIGMEGFSWGVLGGAFAGNFVLQFWGAKKAGLQFEPVLDFSHPDLKKYIKLTLPLMFGLTLFFSMEIFMKFFGSFLPPGSIADLEYSLRTMLLLVAFFGQAFGVASYPFMARLVAENKLEDLNRLLNDTLRYLSLIIPISVLVMVLRHEVMLMLFERGKFDAAATDQASSVLLFFLVGSFAFAANTIVPRAYYATQDTLFPAIYGSLAVLLSVPLYLLGLKMLGTRGVALAASLSAIFQVLLLYILWNRRSGNSGSRDVYRAYLKIIFISSALGILLIGFKQTVLGGVEANTFGGSMQIVLVIGIVFAVLLLLVGYIFRVKEIYETIRRFTTRPRGGHRTSE
ncbi:MAG: murein biosynthesis integral membrane protein MurJ [Desulfobacterales bacterium]|jgi:putative peptidoglycan lipid II flippase